MNWIEVKSNTLQARCANRLGPKKKKLYNKVLECGADKCRKLVWQFNYETHLKQNHSDLSEEAVMKLLGEHTDNFKTAAEHRA